MLSATIYTVDLTTDSGPTSAGSGSGTTGDLRYVINQADANPNTDGSLIQFDPTVFAAPQTIALSASLGTLNLTETSGTEAIDGPAAGVTVSGGNAVGVFSVAKNVTASLSGLTITGGSSANYGGGVYNQGTLTLTGCTVSGNSAADGGGVYNETTLTLTGCTVSGNSAQEGGGGYNNNVGTLTLTGCTVSGNSAGDFGGGLENYRGTLTLTGCTVSGNSAVYGGGGLFNYGHADAHRLHRLRQLREVRRRALNAGTLTLTLTGCTVSGNSAGSGGCGGLYNFSGTASLVDTIVAGNAASSAPSDIGGQAGAAPSPAPTT